MKRPKAIEATLERARHYDAMARDAFGLFRDSAPKKALLDAVTFCIARAHLQTPPNSHCRRHSSGLGREARRRGRRAEAR